MWDTKYMTSRMIEVEELAPLFDCFKCGQTASYNTFIEFKYEHSGYRVLYALVECIGDHAKYPVPMDWFIKIKEKMD